MMKLLLWLNTEFLARKCCCVCKPEVTVYYYFILTEKPLKVGVKDMNNQMKWITKWIPGCDLLCPSKLFWVLPWPIPHPPTKFSWNPSCSVRVILLMEPTNQGMGMKNLFDMRNLRNDGFQKSQHYFKLDPLFMIIPRTWRVCNCSVEWYVQT